MEIFVNFFDIVEEKLGGRKCFYSCCVVLKNLVLECKRRKKFNEGFF